jgi:hypothetical protein
LKWLEGLLSGGEGLLGYGEALGEHEGLGEGEHIAGGCEAGGGHVERQGARGLDHLARSTRACRFISIHRYMDRNAESHRGRKMVKISDGSSTT